MSESTGTIQCPSCGYDKAKSFNYPDTVGYDCPKCGIHAQRKK